MTDKEFMDLEPEEKAVAVTNRALGELKKKPWSWRGWAALLLVSRARFILWQVGPP